MAKNLKGAYNGETNYGVGDIVKADSSYYMMVKDAGAGVVYTDTNYWKRICDPDMIDALELSESVASGASSGTEAAVEAYFPDAKTLVLASSTASSTKKFKITVVDNGTISATEITG